MNSLSRAAGLHPNPIDEETHEDRVRRCHRTRARTRKWRRASTTMRRSTKVKEEEKNGSEDEDEGESVNEIKLDVIESSIFT